MGKIATFFESQGIPLAIKQREQMLSLDEQFSLAEAERDRLKTENLHLQAKVNPLQREVDGLKKKLELKDGLSLSEDEVTILSYLCHVQEATYVATISKDTGINR